MTASVMTTTGGPESSDDCLRDTVTGDEKLPPPTAVTAWTYNHTIITSCLFRWHDHLLFGIQEKAFALHMGMVFHNCTKFNGYNIFKRVEVKPLVS